MDHDAPAGIDGKLECGITRITDQKNQTMEVAMSPRIKKAEYVSPKKLKILFKNGEQKIFDFSRYLDYPVYSPLKDEAFCLKVKVENGVVCWNGEIDFDPDLIYLDSESLPC